MSEARFTCAAGEALDRHRDRVRWLINLTCPEEGYDQVLVTDESELADFVSFGGQGPDGIRGLAAARAAIQIHLAAEGVAIALPGDAFHMPVWQLAAWINEQQVTP